MNVLFLNACIRKESRTLRLCRAYLSGHCAGDTVEEVDVGRLPLHAMLQETLEAREADIHGGKLSGYIHAKAFAAADKIVIGAPYWDSSYPAILKIYIENICVRGVTFESRPDGLHGLCNAKELVYITTAGGFVTENCSLKSHLQELCNMFGIEKLSFLLTEGLDMDAAKSEEILKSAIQKLG